MAILFSAGIFEKIIWDLDTMWSANAQIKVSKSTTVYNV